MSEVELKENDVLIINNESAIEKKTIEDEEKKRKRITTFKWVAKVIGALIGFILIIVIWLLVADVITWGACYVCGGSKRSRTVEGMCTC